MTQKNVSEVAKRHLQTLHQELEREFDADVLGFLGPILHGVDLVVLAAVESLTAARKEKLAVVLDTQGGLVEIVERMVDTIRHHYREIVFVIPDRAMSAGTIFALSGDAIFMDYFSVLGPIDPQIEKEGRLMPAQAYVDEYERLVDLAREKKLTTAEAMLLQKLDLGELKQCREAKELSVDLLKKWLVQYKFKDWKVTATSGQEVTQAMKEERAKKIAARLGDAAVWHSHGRGIPMKSLTSDEINLRIDDLGPRMANFRNYVVLMRDFMVKHQLRSFVHAANHF